MSALPQQVVFATPRRLPKAAALEGRVVVLDIAFAAGTSQTNFEKVTWPLISGLGERLRAWVDHHDHERHVDFAADPRFLLSTKAEHGACPEMIDAALVARVGPVETIVCHVDFDGLASAAKWLRRGVEPYPGCDADARAIDTRLGRASDVANRIDRALRARPNDQALMHGIVRHLYEGLADAAGWAPIDSACAQLAVIEAETRRAAENYQVLAPGIAVVDLRGDGSRIDKTQLLLEGQMRAAVSVVIDVNNVSVAAAFDSGYDFLKLFGIAGGMPTRVSVPHKELDAVFAALGVPEADRSRFPAK